MSEPEHPNEAACGGSALTAELGNLADQFECHALSRSIDDVESAGRAMRAAKAEIERAQQSEREGWRYADELEQERKRLQARIDALMLEYCPDEMTPEQIEIYERHQRAVPNK